MFMLGAQIYDEGFIAKLHRFISFGFGLGLVYWLKVPVAADAAINDLAFMKDIQNFKKVDVELAEVVEVIFQRHGWYVHPRTIVYSLFSENVSVETKVEMAKKLKKLKITKKVPIKSPKVTNLLDPTKSLENYVGPESVLLFQLLENDMKFLSKPVSEWAGDEEFERLNFWVANLKVVNDNAEWAIGVATEVNRSRLTYDEETMQVLLNVISNQRKAVPDFRKKSLINNM